MRILVTGASGFIGRNMLLGLPADWKVTATYHRDPSFTQFLADNSLVNVVPLRVDLAAAEAFTGWDPGERTFDACIYLAANGDPAYSDHAPLDDLRANAVAIVNTLSELKFGHFMFFSSGAVYDGLRGEVDPTSALCPTLPYAISKWASERYVAHARRRGSVAQASIVRFFGAYGPYEASRKIYGRLVRQFAFERNPRFAIRGDGRNLIDAMYVDDTVRAIRLMLARESGDRTYDLCSGAPLTLEALVRTAAARFGLAPEIDFVGEVPEYIEFRSRDRGLREDSGFQPQVPLEEGLERFRRWMAAQGARAPV